MINLLKDIFLGLITTFVFICVITVITTLVTAKVPYVPSKKSLVKKIFSTLKPAKNKNFLDLGCGDGRVLYYAEKHYHLTAIGYEISLLPYLIAKLGKLLGRYKSQVLMKNFFHENLAEADYVFCYLFPETVTKLYDKLKKECKSGTILVSNTFKVKDLIPDNIIQTEDKKQIAYLYKL